MATIVQIAAIVFEKKIKERSTFTPLVKVEYKDQLQWSVYLLPLKKCSIHSRGKS